MAFPRPIEGSIFARVNPASSIVTHIFQVDDTVDGGDGTPWYYIIDGTCVEVQVRRYSLATSSSYTKSSYTTVDMKIADKAVFRAAECAPIEGYNSMYIDAYKKQIIV